MTPFDVRLHALMALTAAALTLSPVRVDAQTAPATLVHAGNLFDSEAGRMVGARDILIRDGKVVEVAPTITAPEGASVLDLRRCSVLPGLIDAHSHILLEQRPNESLSETSARDQGVEGDASRVLAAAPRARAYLEAGITSIRDLGNSGVFLDLILQRGIDRGYVTGPRIYGSGPGLSAAGGQLEPQPSDPDHLVAGEYRIVNGVDDARAAVRLAIANGARVIKIYPESRLRLSVEEIRAIVTEAKRQNIPVAAHATFDAAIREAVEAGVTSIEHGYDISDDTLKLMAEKHVWLVPTDPSDEMAIQFTQAWTPIPPEAEVREHLVPMRDRVRRAMRFGVPIAMGSDIYVPWATGRGQGARMTLGGYVQAGMTPAQALQTATWSAGRLLNDDALGAVRPNAYADLIAMPDDPTAGLTALAGLRFVMKVGRVEVSDGGACAEPDPQAER